MDGSGVPEYWLAGLVYAIANGDAIKIGFSILALAVAAVYVAWRSWHYLNNARIIEDTPTAKARSAHQGYVELQGIGKLIDGPPIIAPLSGLPCVWYRYKIEERTTSGNDKWVTRDKGSSKETFWLEDDTGRVIIDPEGAQISPKHKDVWNSGRLIHLDDIAHNRRSITAILTTPIGGTRYRYTEERINRGDTIYAIGLLKNLGSHIHVDTVDGEVRNLLRDWKKDHAQLLQRFDLNEDGHISQKEWMLARRQARREVQRKRREEALDFNDGVNLLSQTSDRGRPFLLSAYPQHKLVQRYRLGSLLHGIGFFALGSMTLWLFNTRFIS